MRDAVDAGRIQSIMGCGDSHAKNEADKPDCPSTRGTRTIRMCSLDARTRGSTRLSPTEVGEQSLEEGGMKANGLLCSRNAWAEKRAIEYNWLVSAILKVTI